MTVPGTEKKEEQEAQFIKRSNRSFKQVALLPIQFFKSNKHNKSSGSVNLDTSQARIEDPTYRNLHPDCSHSSSAAFESEKQGVRARHHHNHQDHFHEKYPCGPFLSPASSKHISPPGLQQTATSPPAPLTPQSPATSGNGVICSNFGRASTTTTDRCNTMPSGGVDVRVDSRFRVGRKIGSGSFGEIYLGTNLKTEEEVAIKFEHVKKRNPHLLYECKLYRLLAGGLGIPNIHWYGVQGGYTIMVMDLLGPSLEDLFNYCGRKFLTPTTAMLAQQMVDRISYVHSCGIIHRDIKPHNFLIGRQRTKSERTVFIIDFGLAKRYVDPRTGSHIPFRSNKSLTGTARYVSLNTHLGLEQSRRDDLESLGYVFVYFVKGQLPWQGLRATSKKDKYEMIMEKKHMTSLDTLCKHLSPEFLAYLQYCRGLHFTDKPDYQYIISLFKTLEQREGVPNAEPVFDWTLVQANRHSAPQKTNTGNNNTNNATNTDSRVVHMLPAYPSPVAERTN